MKVKELIEKLQGYNPNATARVVVHNREESFSLSYGGSDGSTRETCESVSFWVDRLNQISERIQ